MGNLGNGNERKDLLQYPDPNGYTDYVDATDSPVAAFEEQNHPTTVVAPSPAPPPTAANGAAPPPMGQPDEAGPVAPSPGEGVLLENGAPHLLEEPLPELSNTQVINPLDPSMVAGALPPISTEWPEYHGRNHGVAPPLNINGNPRRNSIPLPKTLKMRPAIEANEKFNEVEEPVRRSLRTGAALNLSMSGVGVEGRDPSRGFLCRPEFIDYGNIQTGVKYGSAVTIMNGGIDSSRFAVKKPKTCDVKYKTGMVAPGMSVRMQVYFCSAEPGEVQQELQITTESDIFRIPIRANVLTEENFDQLAAHERSKATVVQ